jgi:hypothetical protein
VEILEITKTLQFASCIMSLQLPDGTQDLPMRYRRFLKALQPAPVRYYGPRKTCFFDLPAELRNEVYKLALIGVNIHIVPRNSPNIHPHSLLLTSKQVRNEVFPLMHALCPIYATVTDFNFAGLLDFMNRVPPHEEKHLVKNKNLRIELCSTNSVISNDTLRKWLHMRADKYRDHPNWKYAGVRPIKKAQTDLHRRLKRMALSESKTEVRKSIEFKKMLDSIGVMVNDIRPRLELLVD